MDVNIDFIPNIRIKDFVMSDTGKFISKNQLEETLTSVLNGVPKPLLDKFDKCGWTCVVTNQRNLENEYGYNFPVDGLTDFIKKQIIVYATHNGLYYSLPHEMGHVLDRLLGNITDTEEWSVICEREKENINHSVHAKIIKEKYFLDLNNKQEFFADAFLLYCANRPMLTEATKLNDLFDRAIIALEYIDECYIV